MSDSILYNQEVTSEILNDIAIDLGNTSFNGFGEEKFGADELNNITASLVSKGVLLSQDKCKPILNGDNVNIQTGIIVFENGAKKKLTEVVNVPLVKSSYIYALGKDTSCEIIVSSNDPTTDEAVMLQDYVQIAQIDSNGVLIDKRIYSVSKVITPTQEETIKEHITGEAKGYYYSNATKIASYDYGKRYRYVISGDGSRRTECVPILEGPFPGAGEVDNNYGFSLEDRYAWLYFYMEGTKIDVWVTTLNYNAEVSGEYIFV